MRATVNHTSSGLSHLPVSLIYSHYRSRIAMRPLILGCHTASGFARATSSAESYGVHGGVGMVHVIVGERLYDAANVEEHTLGLDALVSRLGCPLVDVPGEPGLLHQRQITLLIQHLPARPLAFAPEA
jgi:hypothetical protein